MIDERRAAALARAYLAAKLAVLRSAYAAEVVAPSMQIQTLSESEFLRELAWVILSAGMAERVVRLKFAAVSEAFLSWSSAAGFLPAKRFALSWHCSTLVTREKLAQLLLLRG